MATLFSAPGAAGRDDKPITVSEAAGMVRAALADGVPSPVRVVGEVSNLSDRHHWFFSLKDERAVLRCVCFASRARRVPFSPEDGMEVVATGRIDYYDASGQVQLYVDKLEPVGQGALELKLRALCEELRKAGYFDPAHKRPLPAVPRRVAVVTSRSAAALEDVIDTARKRFPGCGLALYDVRVQGAAAAPEIAEALERLSRHGPELGIDAVLITRGGGSIEDLWAFNERAVADALYACPLPVVAAIGHETDTTVAELVADLRCATPTQAAMELIPDRETLAHQLEQLARRLATQLSRGVERHRIRLRAIARHPCFRRPEAMLAPVGQKLEQLARRLHGAGPRLTAAQRRELEQRLAPRLGRAIAARRQRAAERLAAHERHLASVSPQRVLERGYSVTLRPDGRALTRARDARAGQTLTTLLAEGRIESQVSGAPRPAPRRKKRAASPDQLGLFDDAAAPEGGGGGEDGESR